MVKRGIVLLWLPAVVCIGFLQLLFSKQFVHDDLSMIRFNIDMLQIQSLSDCFQFVLQQTKPVTNIILALTNWFFGFGVWGQHLVSYLLHLAVVMVWYLVIDRFARRENLSPLMAPLSAVLFALAPVHSETLGIAQFRGEILATLFTLIAWYIAPLSITKQSPLFLGLTLFCVTLAALSKEIFFFIAIFTVSWEWHRLRDLEASARIRKFNSFFALSMLVGFLWVVLYRLYQLDKDGAYSYSGNVAFQYDSKKIWFTFFARALWEGMYKILTGDGLTTVRLSNRTGLGSNLTVFSHILLIVGMLFIMTRAFIKSPRSRGLILLLVLGSGFYLVIPNANVGSEHYWYFAAAPAFALLVMFLLHHIKTQRLFVLLTTSYALFLFVSLQSRLLDYRTRKEFARAELMTHPESWWTWVNWTLAQAEEGKSPAIIDNLFAKASALGGDTLMPTHRLVAALEMGDLKRLDSLLNDCLQQGFRGRGLSSLFTRAGMMLVDSGSKLKAMAAARTALLLYPQNSAAIRLLDGIESSIYRNAPMNEFIARPTAEEKKENAT